MNENPSLMDTDTIFDYYSETYQLRDGSYVNCEIMDTGGHEKYDSINRSYYRRADCCLLVYDITNPDSFKAIENYYIQEIKDNCKENIKVILLGNKADLQDKRKISHEDGAKLAEKNKYIFMETSCETNTNVADAFETLIIMTNNDMIKTGKFNFDEKENIQPFKLEKDNENVVENENYAINDNNIETQKVPNDEELKKNAKHSKETKNKKKEKKKHSWC